MNLFDFLLCERECVCVGKCVRVGEKMCVKVWVSVKV